MKDKIFGVLQRVGRSFMLPIALLPVAGLLLGIGSSFTNPTTIEAYHLANIIREGGLLLSAALTSFVTGITEPLEFTFLFVAPAMYAVHCVLAGLSYMLMHIFGVGVGMTFSGGAIDFLLFGVLQGNAKTHWIWIVIVGAFYAVIYYFVFYFMIKKFNLKTPGREDDSEETKLYTRADMNAKKEGQKSGDAGAVDMTSALILKGLGGKDNLSDVDCCATRLRVTVKDPEKVEDPMLKQSGASGIIHKGNGIQVIYGPKVSVIKSNLEDFMDTPASNDLDAILGSDPADSAAEAEEEKKEAASTIEEIILGAHMNGTAIPLDDVDDEVFSMHILGDGAAIEPAEGKLYAPCDGTITNVFDTKHAITMVSSDNVEILLHVGLDTVKLGGKYFDVHVKNEQKVKKGDLLTTFDMEGIKAEGYKVTTPMVIGNTEDYSEVAVIASGNVNVGDNLVSIK